MIEPIRCEERERLASLETQLRQDHMVAGRDLIELTLLYFGAQGDEASLKDYRELPADHDPGCCCKVCSTT